MQWNSNNPHYLTLNEVHKLFIDYFLKLSVSFVKKDKDEGFDFGDGSSGSDTCKEVKSSVSIEEWVEVWGELVVSVTCFTCWVDGDIWSWLCECRFSESFLE